MTIGIRTIELDRIGPAERSALLTRSAVPDSDIRARAGLIVDSVRDGGDTAVVSFNQEHGGGAASGRLRVPGTAIAEAFARATPELRKALTDAIAAVRATHERQIPADQVFEPMPGVSMARRWTALQRVGVYVPGGGAAYPSSLVMGVVPALVAGVREIAVVCPASPSGSVDGAVLAAAHMLGVTEVYATGGAQAIGALAYGTETIERVQKIVGPGGAWVTAAKLAVYGVVGVDLPAGPSEAAVIVDGTTDPAVAAADLLCQAEHGPDSVVVLVTADPLIARQVLDAASRQLDHLERGQIIREALEAHGLVVIARTGASALRFANEWAPEHVSILTADPRRDAEEVTAAGSVFIGRWTPESAGDYATGANHILPTGGLAAAYGPLATEDFGSWRQVQELTREGLERLAPTIRTLAAHEGLTAHAACVDARLTTADAEVSR